MTKSSMVGLMMAFAMAAWLVGGQVVANEQRGRTMGDVGGEKGQHVRRGMNEAEGMSMQRHRHAMRNGIPHEYRSLDNPLEPTERNLAAGERIYKTNCASCHGASGAGDGPAGKNLNPGPANIARLSRMPMARDSYLYWTIAEGGSVVDSAMPAFGNVLSQEEMWQLVMYVQRM